MPTGVDVGVGVLVTVGVSVGEGVSVGDGTEVGVARGVAVAMGTGVDERWQAEAVKRTTVPSIMIARQKTLPAGLGLLFVKN